jgi:predicted transcriptional regulator
VETPKPSKLELYLEILKSIESKKSTKIEVIQKRTNLDEAFVNHAVSFLEKQNLVEKGNIKSQASYKSTERGERLSRYFTELAQGDLFCLIPKDATCTNEHY